MPGAVEGQEPVAAPLGIQLVAIYHFLSLLSILLLLFSDSASEMPVVIGSILIHGVTAKGILLILNGVSVWIAVGLWTLKRQAWSVFMIYHGIGVLWGVINLLWANDQILTTMIPKELSYPYWLTVEFYRFVTAVGIAVVLSLVLYVYRQRDLFLRKETSGA